MGIEKNIENLNEYIRIDKENLVYDDSDFAQFCRSHCGDIQAVLDELKNSISIKKIEEEIENIRKENDKIKDNKKYDLIQKTVRIKENSFKIEVLLKLINKE